MAAPRFIEPVGRVQTPPEGLLHLLGMKSSGQQPVAFPQTLQPSLDLGLLYRSWHQEWSAHTTAAVGAVGMFGAVGSLVPAGEIWIADQVSLNRVNAMPAATTYRLRLGIYEANTTTPVACSPYAVSATAGEIPFLGWDGPIVLRSGYGLAVLAEAVALGTAQTFYVTFRGCKLAI